jgi:hypothetical protein
MAAEKKTTNGLLRALWERHHRGFLFIALLLFAVAVLFRTSGWAIVISVYVVLLVALELLYRATRFDLELYRPPFFTIRIAWTNLRPFKMDQDRYDHECAHS